MRSSTDSDPNFKFCKRCRDISVSAVSICDGCDVVACIHVSAVVDGKILCSICLERAGYDPPNIIRWFWPEDDE